ncbi:MAG TPA: type II toxin-antitoxin system VapB family antitoxin [Bryobacteraceae bacterium]
MKRTNVVLDEDRLEEARRLLGAKTYSDTINAALSEAIRSAKIRSLPDLLRKVRWKGDLSEMRDDHPHRHPGKRHPGTSPKQARA